MSKNPKGKNAFTSLRINRAAEEEIKKYNNNGIHFAYSASKNSNSNNKNNKISLNINQNKYSNGSSELKYNNTNYQTKNINNSSKKKEKNNINDINQSYTDYKIKPKSKINKSGIVINIYSRKNDKDFISINDENNYENENQTEKEEDNIKNNFEFDDNYALNIVRNLWMKNSQISNETNVDIYCIKKNNLSKNKIIKAINFNIKPNKPKPRPKNKLIKENCIFFSLYKTRMKLNKLLYTPSNYIRDLSNSIFLQKEKQNELYIINPPNNENISKLNYTKINPKDHNELESDLNNYYTKNKSGYYINIDNNDDIEEQKLKPIYVINKPQINLLYNELIGIKEIKEEKKEEKKEGWGIGKNILSISRQVGVDYEIIEVFTPRLNKDNNTNRTLTNNINNISSKEENNINNYINSNIINSNINNSKEFGQVTPLSMLSEKFFYYAISRNIKFSIPDNQGFINFLNYNNYKRKDYDKDYTQLQKNKFSLKIVRTDNKNEKNNSNININNNKRKNNNVIDYSKYSSGSEKFPKNK